MILRAVVLAALFVTRVPAERAANCSTSGCPDNLFESSCPPDSVLVRDPDSNLDTCCSGPAHCECNAARCIEPVCHFSSNKTLQRRGTGKPGDCCDVYECVVIKENCSSVVCPEEGPDCPADSYKLPGHRAPSDCCSKPQGCQCMPCSPADCEPGQRARVVRRGNSKPGTCCPLYQCVHDDNLTCSHGERRYPSGSVWRKDRCTECRCEDGLTFCSTSVQCPDVASCPFTRVPEGDCCPVCVGSGPAYPDGCVASSGKIYKNNQSWQEDPCTTCTCREGEKKCQAYMCEVSCVNPRHAPGECCPLCDAASVITLPPFCPALNCSLRCMHGFMRDQVGCYRCRCQAEECTLVCPFGYVQDTHENKLCQCQPPPLEADCPSLTQCHKNCSHGYKLNRAGCEVCKCNKCRPLEGCTKTCRNGFRTNDRGCAICKCNASPDTTLEVHKGHRPSIHVDHGVTCVTANSEHYDEGESWFDGCRQCYCHGGKEMCTLITCPAPSCSNPVFLTGECCPRCPETPLSRIFHNTTVCHSVDGLYRVEGETWSLNSCTSCICHRGQVLCETNHCPPAPCSDALAHPGTCCSQCPGFRSEHSEQSLHCLYPDTHTEYSHGDMWKLGACQSCICQHGEIQCYSEHCPPANCDRPVLRKNQCCPMCLDQSTPKTCVFENITYLPDEKWYVDECTTCVCVKGRKMCTEKVCSVACSNPVKIPGQCCPICPDTGDGKAETMPPGLVQETTYIVTISVLFVVVVFLVVYILVRLCQNRKKAEKNGPKSLQNPAYSGFPPPRYSYVPSYDQQMSGMLKSPSPV